MKLEDFLARMARRPDDGAGAGSGAGGAASGDGGDAGAGGDGAGGAGDAGGSGEGSGAEGKAGAKWWEGAGIDDDTRQFLTLNGLTVDDPIEAAAKAAGMARNAQKRLGHKPEDILVRPKEGQSMAEWMKANREVFGMPEKAEDYTIAKPESFKGEWDGDLAKAMQQVGYAEGVPPAAMAKMTEAFARHVETVFGQETDKLAAADAKMREALTQEWGDQTEARVAMARQAAQVLAQKAGLDADAFGDAIQLLSAKTGDANVMRLFHAIGDAMGDDQALGLGKSGGGFSTTPAEARAEAAKLRAEGGEYYEAVKSQNQDRIRELRPRLAQLDKIASQGG